MERSNGRQRPPRGGAARAPSRAPACRDCVGAGRGQGARPTNKEARSRRTHYREPVMRVCSQPDGSHSPAVQAPLVPPSLRPEPDTPAEARALSPVPRSTQDTRDRRRRLGHHQRAGKERHVALSLTRRPSARRPRGAAEGVGKKNRRPGTKRRWRREPRLGRPSPGRRARGIPRALPGPGLARAGLGGALRRAGRRVARRGGEWEPGQAGGARGP